MQRINDAIKPTLVSHDASGSAVAALHRLYAEVGPSDENQVALAVRFRLSKVISELQIGHPGQTDSEYLRAIVVKNEQAIAAARTELRKVVVIIDWTLPVPVTSSAIPAILL
jgi:hypothetical protein